MSKWNNRTIAKHFAEGGQGGAASNVFIDGDTIYSYGHHFPIARRLTWDEQQKLGVKFVFNLNGYSNSTAKHKSNVASAIRDFVAVPSCDLSEEALKALVDKIEREEILIWEDKLKVLKTRGGQREKSYLAKIQSGKEQLKQYMNVLTNLHGSTSVLFIKDLAKQTKGVKKAA